MNAQDLINGAGSFSRREGLKAAKNLVALFDDCLKAGSIELKGVVIQFGEDDVKFTQTEYAELAKRALEASITSHESEGGRN